MLWEIHFATYICYHFPSGLVSFPVVSSFLFLLQNSFPGGAVFQSKFANNFAELIDVDFTYCIGRMAHK